MAQEAHISSQNKAHLTRVFFCLFVLIYLELPWVKNILPIELVLCLHMFTIYFLPSIFAVVIIIIIIIIIIMKGIIENGKNSRTINPKLLSG